MIGFFLVLDDLVKRGLIDPNKDKWDKPEDWELTKCLKAAEEEIKKKIESRNNGNESIVKEK